MIKDHESKGPRTSADVLFARLRSAQRDGRPVPWPLFAALRHALVGQELRMPGARQIVSACVACFADLPSEARKPVLDVPVEEVAFPDVLGLPRGLLGNKERPWLERATPQGAYGAPETAGAAGDESDNESRKASPTTLACWLERLIKDLNYIGNLGALEDRQVGLLVLAQGLLDLMEAEKDGRSSIGVPVARALREALEPLTPEERAELFVEEEPTGEDPGAPRSPDEPPPS